MSQSIPGAELAPEDRPILASRHTGLLMAALMSVTIIQFLDATIVNVALRHMQSDLSGAGPESISWALTSFIIAGVIGMPATGWLADRIGSRKLFLLATSGFVLSSMLCGIAANLTQIVLFRTLQGLTTAFMGPMSQAIIFDIIPPSKQGRSMAIWGGAVMVAPICGPMVGGYLTEYLNWRWCFYVNVPIGIPALAVLWWLLPSRPKHRRKLDLTGLAMIGIGLASMQLVLDRGHSKDWFESPEIVIEAIVAISAFWMFGVHSWKARTPLFSPVLFSNRSFVAAAVFMAFTGITNVALSSILPMLYQNVLGYDVIETGKLMAPRGVAIMCMMPIAAILVERIDNRLVISMGYLICAYSLWMMTGWSLEMTEREIVIAGLVQGLGMGLLFAPVNVIAFNSISPHHRAEGTSIMTLTRNIGASFGISGIITAFSRNSQISHSDIAASVTSYNLPTIDPASTAERAGTIGQAGLVMLNGEVTRQAMMVAYLDGFYALVWVMLAVAFVPFLLEPTKGRKVKLDHLAEA